MSASHFFFLPQYIFVSFNFVHTCFFCLCLLCCVVLYKWLEADLHGKSSDTADKTSGKEALRTKQSPGPPSLSLFSLFQLLNRVRVQKLRVRVQNQKQNPWTFSFFYLIQISIW